MSLHLSLPSDWHIDDYLPESEGDFDPSLELSVEDPARAAEVPVETPVATPADPMAEDQESAVGDLEDEDPSEATS